MKAENYTKQVLELRKNVLADIKEEFKRLAHGEDVALETELPVQFSVSGSDLANLIAEEVLINDDDEIQVKLWNDFTGSYQYEYEEYFTTDQLIFILNQLQTLTEL